MVRPALEGETRRYHTLPVIMQVLACLRFLASESFQNVVGDTMHISQPSWNSILYQNGGSSKPVNQISLKWRLY